MYPATPMSEEESKSATAHPETATSKQPHQRQDETAPMRTFSFYFCSFSETIKLQDRDIWAGTSPKK